MQMITMNLVLCLVIFGILVAINKQPQQTHSDNPIKISGSMLENNKCKTCMDSKLFCTSLFCCCYCCFNFSEEDDVHSTTSEVAHNFRKTFLIPVAPWIHAIIIFLNVRYTANKVYYVVLSSNNIIYETYKLLSYAFSTNMVALVILQTQDYVIPINIPSIVY